MERERGSPDDAGIIQLVPPPSHCQGLANGGQTAHYQISYDTSLSTADGLSEGVPITSQELVPAKPFTITGKVSDTSGSQIAGATITLAQNSPVPGRIQITTDASGNYSVSSNN